MRPLRFSLLVLALIVGVGAQAQKPSVWERVQPRQAFVQYAGNMGLLSAGVGWDYGRKRQWETALMAGIVPKYNSDAVRGVFTVKETFVPWRLKFRPPHFRFEPLTCGLYVNAITGRHFWTRQPERYPSPYYHYFCTRWRINVFVGERFDYELPRKFKHLKSIGAFYEVSLNDFEIFEFVENKGVSLWNACSLSLGLKLQLR